MTDHLHLLMTLASEEGRSLLMKGLGQRYVQHINRTYRRTGTLFKRRFRSSVIEADRYLLACQRYIDQRGLRPRQRALSVADRLDGRTTHLAR